MQPNAALSLSAMSTDTDKQKVDMLRPLSISKLLNETRSACIVILVLLFLSRVAAVVSAGETPAQTEARLAWWREARFGLFMHWGLYAVPAGEWKGQEKQKDLYAEWIMQRATIPVAEYEQLAARFNPVQFNADRIVRIARDAGMKYIVITAKHCDGFAMFHSKISKYNVVDDTPFARDPMAELAKAAKRQGIKLGFYYSHCWDWHEPDATGLINDWDFPPKEKRVPDRYFHGKSLPQVEELMSQYHPAIMWFDVPDLDRAMSQNFLDIIHRYMPECVVNDRIGNGLGDYATPEQTIPPESMGKPFEVCMTLNNHWGYDQNDHAWKDARTVIRNLADIVSKGGNYLLNVGPTAEGVLPPEAVRILGEVGAWMKVNGESIHGTVAGPFVRLPWGVCSARPGKLYLHVFDWPADGRLFVPGLRNQIKRARLLAGHNRATLATDRSGDSGCIIRLPEKAADTNDTVVVLEIEGAPKVDPQNPGPGGQPKGPSGN
jgi:alpha-L-fucosidase